MDKRISGKCPDCGKRIVYAYPMKLPIRHKCWCGCEYWQIWYEDEKENKD